MVKLFVGGFPLDMQEIELVKLFNTFAEISTIKIVRDKATRKCKGYAFLETTGLAGAEMAINALNGKIMEGKALTVKIADEKEASPRPFFTKTQSSQKAVNYVKLGRASESIKPKRPRKLKP